MSMLPLKPTISRREWGIAALIALGVMGLTVLPYALGYLTAREGTFFTGLLMNPEDSQTYFAKMLQGYDGQWLYSIPFTPEPHEAAFVGVFYVWLGQLARFFGLNLTAAWHIARLAAGLILFLVSYRFIAIFVTAAVSRWTAYLLALTGSGLGWLLFILNQPYWLDAFPVDFKQPESHLFFSALTYPHVLLGTALMLVTLMQLLKSAGSQHRSAAIRAAAAAGVSNLALGIFYPFLIYLIAPVAGISWLAAFRQGWLGKARSLILSLAFIIPAPLFLYYDYVLQVNPVFRAWDLQAGTPSPPWPHYLAAFGPMLLLAGLVWWKRPHSRRQFGILWVWIATALLLLYMPLRPQRRFVQGLQLPLAILSGVAWVEIILPWLSRRRGWQRLVQRPRYSTAGINRLLITLFLLFMGLSNLYVLASSSVSAVIQQPYPLFRPTEERQAAAWLREQSGGGTVIGEYESGNYIAAQAGNRVMLGHWAETVDIEGKRADVEQFYQTATSDSWRQELIEQFQIRYVFHGPRERSLGGFEPSEAAYLTPVFQSETIQIYRVAE